MPKPTTMPTSKSGAATISDIMILVLTTSMSTIGWVFQNELVEWIEMTTTLFTAPETSTRTTSANLPTSTNLPTSANVSTSANLQEVASGR